MIEMVQKDRKQNAKNALIIGAVLAAIGTGGTFLTGGLSVFCCLPAGFFLAIGAWMYVTV